MPMTATERFPAVTYIHRLEDMTLDLRRWSNAYGSLAYTPDSNPRKEKYEDREALLEEAAHELDKAIAILRALPRLS